MHDSHQALLDEIRTKTPSLSEDAEKALREVLTFSLPRILLLDAPGRGRFSMTEPDMTRLASF